MPSSGMLHHVVLVRFFIRSVRWLLVTVNVPCSPILVTLMMEALSPPKRRQLQEPHGVTSQKMAFFIVTVLRSPNLTEH
jgi:hypothetical protein